MACKGVVIKFYLQELVMVVEPEPGDVACLLGSDSQTTCYVRPVSIVKRICERKGHTLPSVSLRMNLYWKVVLAGRVTETVQVG